ncbi:MAG TPA: 50S ribosomal protein L24 [Planctomycetes bacterium]|nr:50S ribosomal protein L24 [Planctomycetota bacterium]
MLTIKRNDLVEVIAGDEKGKRGRVVRVLLDKRKVVVQGLNLHYRHVRRSQKHPQGGRIRRETPIDVSNVLLVDPSSDRPTRYRVRRDGDAKVRCAVKSGQAIDKA